MLKKTLYKPEHLDALPPGSIIKWKLRYYYAGILYYKGFDKTWYVYPGGSHKVFVKALLKNKAAVVTLEG